MTVSVSGDIWYGTGTLVFKVPLAPASVTRGRVPVPILVGSEMDNWISVAEPELVEPQLDDAVRHFSRAGGEIFGEAPALSK
jgi:hypothetical protein